MIVKTDWETDGSFYSTNFHGFWIGQDIAPTPHAVMQALSTHWALYLEPVLGAAAATGSKLVGKFLNLFLRREHSLYSAILRYYLLYTQR